MTAPRGTTLLCALLVVHVVWGVVRIPGKVYGRRWEDIERYRALGAAGFFLDTEHYRGADTVRWLSRHVPEDRVLLWRGAYEGALEFVPRMLAPRLLVAEDSCPPSATAHAGIPLAMGELPDGRRGVLVLVGKDRDLGLEVR